jgi:hypothetical protein
MADEQANKPHRKAKDPKKKNKTPADGTARPGAIQRLTVVQERIPRHSPLQSRENCRRELLMLMMYVWLQGA